MKRRIGYESAAAIANGLIALVAAVGLSGCFEPDSRAKADAAAAAEAGPPIISDLPAETVVTVGQSFALAPSATDPRGGALTFSVVNKPYWADFDTSTGRLAGTPVSTDVGVYANVQISASNGSLEALSNSFSVVVEADPVVATDPPPPADNAPPTISGNPAQYVTEGQPYSFHPSATDPDNDALTFSIMNRPFWASFDTGTGALTGTPPAGAAGTFLNIEVSVSDGSAVVSLPAFTIIVEPVNRAPYIAGNPPTTVREGFDYLFRPVASDADGNALTFTIDGRPSWASFNPANGELSGTPPLGSAGVYGNIIISATDGALSSSLPAFAITVAANRAPSIGGTPAGTVTVGQSYSFTPTASDADGDSLTFSISNRPSWLTFNAGTGRISGTPSAAAVGEYVGIVISVSDGYVSSSLPAFRIVVEAGNRAPTITGTPPTAVVEGQAYSFVPVASDPDGDPLTFSIANRPSWATFSTSTGALSGTPAVGTVGTYSGIRISVTDGTDSASLAEFAIQVQQAATGTATVSWTPPTARTDGTPLTDLAGYKVHYGTTLGSYPNVIVIDNAGVTTYVVENLAPATYYFVTTAFDTTGAESDYSNVASKTIR
jgi:hypothetical protein